MSRGRPPSRAIVTMLPAAASLAREAGSPSLSRELSDWGFLAGADRYFQGESHQLQVVDSRTFRFKSAAGAASFVAFVGSALRAM